MNKSDLINAVATKENITKKAAGSCVDAVIASITKALVSGEDVKLTGFGNWTIKESAERVGRNPATGDELKIPAKKTVKFKVASNIKTAVAEH